MAEDLRAATIVCAIYNSSMGREQGSRPMEPSDVFRTIPKPKRVRLGGKALAKKIMSLAN